MCEEQARAAYGCLGPAYLESKWLVVSSVELVCLKLADYFEKYSKLAQDVVPPGFPVSTQPNCPPSLDTSRRKRAQAVAWLVGYMTRDLADATSVVSPPELQLTKMGSE